ncbi:MAG: hypothetical protein ACJ78U_12475, partial [Myxococcales bacterium]
MAKNGKSEVLSASPATSSVSAVPSSRTGGRRAKGTPVERRTTREGQTAAEVLAGVEWTRRPAKISGA